MFAIGKYLAKVQLILKEKAKKAKCDYTPEYSLVDVWNFANLQSLNILRMDLFSFRKAENVERWTLKSDNSVGGTVFAEFATRNEETANLILRTFEFRTTLSVILTPIFPPWASILNGTVGKTVAEIVFDGTTERELTKWDDKAFAQLWKLPLKKTKAEVTQDLEKVMGLRGHDEVEGQKPVDETNEEDRNTPGCLHFFGNLSLELPAKPNIEKSGYACIESPRFYPPLDLTGFDGLELRIKSDGRLYVVQVKTSTSNKENLYQLLIPPAEPGKWTKIYLPWLDFVLTWRGYEEQIPSPLEPNDIEYIAILMAERQDGPFSMKIDWIHAIRDEHKRQAQE